VPPSLFPPFITFSTSSRCRAGSPYALFLGLSPLHCVTPPPPEITNSFLKVSFFSSSLFVFFFFFDHRLSELASSNFSFSCLRPLPFWSSPPFLTKKTLRQSVYHASSIPGNAFSLGAPCGTPVGILQSPDFPCFPDFTGKEEIFEPSGNVIPLSRLQGTLARNFSPPPRDLSTRRLSVPPVPTSRLLPRKNMPLFLPPPSFGLTVPLSASESLLRSLSFNQVSDVVGTAVAAAWFTRPSTYALFLFSVTRQFFYLFLTDPIVHLRPRFVLDVTPLHVI